MIGDKTANRTAGSGCNQGVGNKCTPYKKNFDGAQFCKVTSTSPPGEDVGSINPYSYLEHEYKQAVKKGKTIVILYNSTRNEKSWLPEYITIKHAEIPFWIIKDEVGNYQEIKKALVYI